MDKLEAGTAAIWAAWVAAGGTVVGAGGALWAAATSRSASRSAAKAAETVASIEQDRRREELAPRFRIRCFPPGPTCDTAVLSVTLVGPPGLTFLEEVSIELLDGRQGVTPWLFRQGIDGVQERRHKFVLSADQRQQILRREKLVMDCLDATETARNSNQLFLKVACRHGRDSWIYSKSVPITLRP